MFRLNKKIIVLVCVMPLLCGALLGTCAGGLEPADFVQVSLDGFDPEDNFLDKNTYPWAIAPFQADEDKTEYLYVGTGNNIVPLIGANSASYTGEAPFSYVLVKPPEIRRYRPDLGPTVWEKVFDYRDVESGQPFFYTVGFRYMTTYRAAADGVNYIYAATFGQKPALWRSASGAYGTWEKVFEFDTEGSVRSMAVHNGILYFAPTDEISGDPGPAEVWATDGDVFWNVVSDGFGGSYEQGVATMASFNDYLYVGLATPTGGELWRLEGVGDKAGPPVQVVANGGADARNEVFGTSCVFKDHLYIGTLIFGGANDLTGNGPKGADIIRVGADDSWDTIVGPCGLSGYGPGFTKIFNGYMWSMAEHDGWLYAGTSDFVSFVVLFLNALEWGTPCDMYQQFLDFVEQFSVVGAVKTDQSKIFTPEFNERITGAGADLFKSYDGVHWYPVFTDGLGESSSGIRVMQSWNGSLYLGFAIPFTGLEIWQGTSEQQADKEPS